MPLVAFSKILSPKSFARHSQLYSSSASECSAEHLGSPSSKTPSRASSSANASNPKQEKANIGRNRNRHSKAFTFSLDPFNVVASFRTRSKIREAHSHPESSFSSRPVSHQSQTVYSGYEDEEYGEPEADAEEIRRPSGLGRRASHTDMSTEVGEEVGKNVVDHGSIKEFQPVQNVPEETESRKNSVSDMSDIESLVEIRYPSGLGNIRLAIHASKNERPLSTYPYFQPGVPEYDGCTEESAQTPIARLAPTALPQSPSVYLSTLLPFLSPYLSPPTLTSLALVDRAVGKKARDLLWRSISMSVAIRSAEKKKMSMDGTNSKVLDVISTGYIAHLVRSLELTCRLESTTARLASNFPPRSRPPPLILAPKTAVPLRSRNALILSPAPTQSQSAPLPSKMVLEVHPEPGPDIVTTALNNGEPDVIPSNMRRFSLLLRNSSLTLKSNVPDALRTKLRPTSLRLAQPLSLFRSRSSELLGQTSGTNASRSPNPSSLSDVAKASAFPFNLPSSVREAKWTPPQEWDRIDVTDSTQLFPPPSAPLPSTGWSAPPEWRAGPPSRPDPDQKALHWQPLTLSLTSSNPHSDLRLSPSLPSLRALNSPPTQSKEEVPSSPMTAALSPAAPSPVTPYSAVSLSAFPLPPPSVTSPGVSPFPSEFSYLSLPEPDNGVPPSMSSPTQDHVLESDLPTNLAEALKKMVNLEQVTLRYVSSEFGNPGLDESPYTSMRENIDLSLVKKANETLGTILPGLRSLKTLKILCHNAHYEVCRSWWQELTQPLQDFELDVTCLQDAEINTC